MWWNCCDHALPICSLVADWFLNKIFFEFNQLWANLVVFLIYGFVNIGVTKGTGKPVYDPISWDSVVSWIVGLAILPLAAIYFIALYYLTRYKFRKMKMHDAIEYNSVITTSSQMDCVSV